MQCCSLQTSFNLITCLNDKKVDFLGQGVIKSQQHVCPKVAGQYLVSVL